jgi:hypothetical protein
LRQPLKERGREKLMGLTAAVSNFSSVILVAPSVTAPAACNHDASLKTADSNDGYAVTTAKPVYCETARACVRVVPVGPDSFRESALRCDDDRRTGAANCVG